MRSEIGGLSGSAARLFLTQIPQLITYPKGQIFQDDRRGGGGRWSKWWKAVTSSGLLHMTDNNKNLFTEG